MTSHAKWACSAGAPGKGRLILKIVRRCWRDWMTQVVLSAMQVQMPRVPAAPQESFAPRAPQLSRRGLPRTDRSMWCTNTWKRRG